jgi:nitroreductase
VRAAILAASPHNIQPWLFRVTASQIDVLADQERSLGAIDPLQREKEIGLGCAVENLVLSAEAHGSSATVTLLPSATDSTHVARIDLLPAKPTTSPLYQAIPHRHTNRYAYDTRRTVSHDTLAALRALSTHPDIKIVWLTSRQDRAQFARLEVEATQALIADPEQVAEDARWYRADWHLLQRERDGLTLDAMGISDFDTILGKLLPPSSVQQNEAAFLQLTKEVYVATAAAFGLIVVRRPLDTKQRLQVGRLWQRLHLWATGRGLAMQPLNQIAERADREQTQGHASRFSRALQELVGDAGWHVIFLFRLGYPTREAAGSPRRAVQEVMLR